MSNSQENQNLRKKLIQIITEKINEIQALFPKLDIADRDGYLKIAGKVLLGDKYFCFRCVLTKEAREPFNELKAYSNGYFSVLDGRTVEIAINDEEKLCRFLGPGNKYVEDKSVRLVSK